MSHAPDESVERRRILVAAELGLLALALGTAASLVRLFDGWGWLATLAGPVTLGWATSVVARRARLGVAMTALAQVVAGIFVMSWWFAPGTLALVLPTPATYEVLTDEIAASFGSFSELVAPVPATTGFLVVIAAALWVIAGFADVAAFRFEGPVQAAVPYVAAFAAAGILGRNEGRITAALVFGLGLLAFAVTQRTLAGVDERWVGGRRRAGVRTVAVSGLFLGLLGLVAGLASAPVVPGTEDAVIDLRELGRGSGPRTVVSPFVGLRSLLGERTDDVMFTVRAEEPAYWRLTSLEEFDPDRDIWVSRSSYQRTDGDLPPSLGPEVAGSALAQEFEIGGLASLWLPAAYAPSQVQSTADLSYDARSSSIILRDDTRTGQLRYTLESVVPDFGTLEDASTTTSGELGESYSQAEPLAPEVQRQLDDITAGATSDVERLLALQSWFRTFQYAEDVDYSGSTDALAAFLVEQRGFCQQFSSAFALLARSMGIPARVAVGFTPGDRVAVGADEPGGATEYVVRGRHAHAWPEVHFEGLGWIPFEPTPQRGNPQAEQYTGVAAQQATPPPEQAVTTAGTAPTTTSPEQPPTSAGEQVDATSGASSQSSTDSDAPDQGPVALAAAALALVLIAGTIAILRRRRPVPRHGDEAMSAAVARSWRDAVRGLGLVGLRPMPSETPAEFARRAEAHFGDDLIGELAGLETRRRYGSGAPTFEDTERAHDLAADVVDRVRVSTSRRERVGARMNR